MSERKVVVVTGAGSGIGRAVAIRAARAGCAVLAVSLHKDAVETTVSEIARSGGACASLALDVTVADAPARIAGMVQSQFGRVDVIVNCAGAAIAGRLLEQSDAQIDGQWQLHVAAPLRITRAALPLLQAAKGHVLFIGSGLSRVPAPYYGAYCAAKAAVRAMAAQLRRELHGSGIAVTFVDPGSVRTDFARHAGIAPYGPDAAVDPTHVAERIVRAFDTRPRVLNAVPLHALGAMLGEWFPHFADRVFATRPAPAASPQPQPQPPPHLAPEISAFERALQPVARRMERVKLSPSFLQSLLQSEREIALTDAAMRWAGMPNKNERAAMHEALDALAAGGFLERTGDETWSVLRTDVTAPTGGGTT